ncbi:MAG: CDP-alcohol phosphatidyltransferase family protein [Deltaproteobacteria bacterium]|nr:CDP-alcohol phosphatidyltransferase family protein [Deltaproteobacteria bacterium]
MLRELVLADLLTLGNAACGTLAIFMCLKWLDGQSSTYIWIAFGLIPVALLLDILDGAVARWRRKSSYLGADLDSLADIVSFGVAPAVLGYTLGLRGGWDVLVLVLFVTAGISRLARYNATLDQLGGEDGKVPYYEGLPIPSSVLLAGVLAAAFGLDAFGEALWLGEVELLGAGFHPLAAMYLLAGCAMVSATVRIPKP